MFGQATEERKSSPNRQHWLAESNAIKYGISEQSQSFYFQVAIFIFSTFQMNSALQQQRLEVEQLRREAAMKRIPVSQAVEDIKVFHFHSFLCQHPEFVSN